MATLGQRYNNKDTRDGIAVNKTFMVPVDLLIVEEGKNVRDIDQQHVEYFSQCWTDGEPLPPLMVRSTDKGIVITDGHHRFFGAKLANERGQEIIRIECKEFTGSVADEIAFMITSSQGKHLTPVERGNGYLRLKKQGWTNDEISKKVKRSTSDVQQHLSLIECSPGIIEKVQNNQMSYAMAIEMQREHGDKAAEVAEKAIEKAKSEGKSKITKADTKPQFSAKQARRLVELLFDAQCEQQGNWWVISGIQDGTQDEIMQIIKSYRDGK